MAIYSSYCVYVNAGLHGCVGNVSVHRYVVYSFMSTTMATQDVRAAKVLDQFEISIWYG